MISSKRTAWGFAALLLFPILVPSTAAAAVKMAQTVSLVKGWNAVYVAVSPEESADDVFGGWPVERVAAYDPAAFLTTKQYSAGESTEGTSRIGYRMWRRGEPDLSPVKSVVANSVYVCYATNAHVCTLYGAPAAPRITWHPSSTNDAMNLVGISIAPGDKTTPAAYFDGLDAGNVNALKFYTIGGGDSAKLALGSVSSFDELGNGETLVMPATKASDWSGVLNVSPMGGVDFSTNLTEQVVIVRNDGASARTMSLRLIDGDAAPGEAELSVPPGLMLRDASVSTNAWLAFGKGGAFERWLGAGEEVKLSLAIDRTQMKSAAAGTRYGGLLVFADVDGGSKMRVMLPVEATRGDAASVARLWPTGLWLAQGSLSVVTSYDRAGVGTDVAAGGTAKVRLPVYVDENGVMTLLSRFVYGSDSNGVTHVYSPKTESEFPVPIVNAKRVTSAVLPIDGDNAMVKAADGAFGANATFAFTVGENSRVNPMLHTFHPSHDGLRLDFETAAPSGDDLRNYLGTVKPETFSITNRVTFVWDDNAGAAWNPEERLSGTLVWELGGVRREGAVRMKGAFAMKRISNVEIDK